MKDPSVKQKILGGLWGSVVGDALGLPVEFQSREERKKDPITGMRGYGIFNQPPGTWSDDSSLMLCTVESLLDGCDTNHMGQLFIRWLNDAYWTPWGQAFDVGMATQAGIKRLMRGVLPEEAGGVNEDDNGNGSLMRILPIGLYFANAPVAEMLDAAHRVSAVTHRHPRSQMVCGFYCLMVSYLLMGVNPEQAYKQAIEEASRRYDKPPYAAELRHFIRLFSGQIESLPENEIQSGGYVIHTLEASLWCLLTTSSYEKAVLKAVNLGEDTDTTGTVTGGLAGIFYGSEAIPKEWLDQVARKDDISRLFEKYLSFS
jgi:ADP-ribosyl-[dinitrogen reductase] hydrolase